MYSFAQHPFTKIDYFITFRSPRFYIKAKEVEIKISFLEFVMK